MFEYLHDKAWYIILTINDFSHDFIEFMSNPVKFGDYTIFESGFDLLGITALTAILIRVVISVFPRP